MLQTKIERLTAEQEHDLEVTIVRWIQDMRSVEPIDRVRATSAVKAMYREIGEPEPVVFTFSSPLMCILAWDVLHQFGNQIWDQLWGRLRDQLWDKPGKQIRDQIWDQLGGQLRDQLRDQLWDQFGGQLGDQIGDNLRDQLWDLLGDNLWDQLRDQLGGQLRDQLWDQLRDQLRDKPGNQISLRGQLWDQLTRDQLRDQLSNYFGGPYWSYWYAVYDFCNRIGVQYTEDQRRRLDLWIAQSRDCHWWFPYKGVVLMSERHNRVEMDADGRLHSEDGLACGYPDGWGVYAWHGVRVPEDIILKPEAITSDQIDKETNVEVRRVMMERMGFDRYILESGTTLIHSDECGALYRKEFPDDEPLTVVHVVNSTAEPDGSVKKYMLRVHPELRPMLPDGEMGEPQEMTARNAVASTFGLRGVEYAPGIQT